MNTICEGIERMPGNIWDGIIMIKLQAKSFDINVIQVYAPTSSGSEEVLGDFSKNIEKQLRM